MSENLKLMFSELEVKLAELNKHSKEFNQNLTTAINLIEEHLYSIQEKLAIHVFQSKNTEISYFKNEFPKIFRLYYYYQTTYSIEKEKVKNCIYPLNEQEYYANYLQNFNYFNSEELKVLQVYHFYPLEKENKFFLRKHFRWRRKNLMSAINDTYITNTISAAIGKREALIDIINYLEKRSKTSTTNEIEYKTEFNWTDNKCDLVELVYAIFIKESINNGDIELTQLIKFFETSFNIQLNNHHTTIQEIKQRKKERTKYIDNLKIRLDKKLLE